METTTMLPVADDVFATRSSDEDPWQILVFYDVPGHGSYVHTSGRATPRRG